jgi:hypothetical protein
MERTTKQVKLPVSGIVADLVTAWTYREYREVETLTGQAAGKVTMVNGQPVSEVDMSKIADAEMRAMTITVKKLVTPEGVEIPVSMDAIGDLVAEDGIFLKDSVDEVAKAQKKT